jgi:hypothetical protein
MYNAICSRSRIGNMIIIIFYNVHGHFLTNLSMNFTTTTFDDIAFRAINKFSYKSYNCCTSNYNCEYYTVLHILGDIRFFLDGRKRPTKMNSISPKPPFRIQTTGGLGEVLALVCWSLATFKLKQNFPHL